MKFPSDSSLGLLLAGASVVFGLPALSAATVMTMTFDHGGVQIDEVAGWDGTSATGGFLASGLSVASGMRIHGDFTGGSSADTFHVDNWHTDNTSETRVGFTVAAQPGYTLSLGGGSETFSTRVHEHPTNAPDIFTSVTLRINGLLIGSQAFTPGGGAQTLVWNIASNPSLDGLNSATFDLYFTGTSNPSNNNHGPEWALADGAFVSFTGVVTVPEPASSLFACLGMAMAFRRQRSR